MADIRCIKLAILCRYGDDKRTMVTKQIKELEAAKAKMVALEKSIARGLHKELAALHKTYGYATLNDFVKALKAVCGPNVDAVSATNSDGLFRVPSLIDGPYKVTVTAPGFKKEVYDGLTLRIGENLNVDLKLQVGAVSEAVEVTSSL